MGADIFSHDHLPVSDNLNAGSFVLALPPAVGAVVVLRTPFLGGRIS